MVLTVPVPTSSLCCSFLCWLVVTVAGATVIPLSFTEAPSELAIRVAGPPSFWVGDWLLVNGAGLYGVSCWTYTQSSLSVIPFWLEDDGSLADILTEDLLVLWCWQWYWRCGCCLVTLLVKVTVGLSLLMPSSWFWYGPGVVATPAFGTVLVSTLASVSIPALVLQPLLVPIRSRCRSRSRCRYGLGVVAALGDVATLSVPIQSWCCSRSLSANTVLVLQPLLVLQLLSLPIRSRCCSCSPCRYGLGVVAALGVAAALSVPIQSWCRSRSRC